MKCPCCLNDTGVALIQINVSKTTAPIIGYSETNPFVWEIDNYNLEENQIAFNEYKICCVCSAKLSDDQVKAMFDEEII